MEASEPCFFHQVMSISVSRPRLTRAGTKTTYCPLEHGP